jgi:AcrR family transcriptional regulator
MGRRPYDQRLRALIGTAARVFARKGFHPTTMRDLSRETGMSLAGMYHYVDSKDELLFLVQQQCFEEVSRGAATAVAAAGDDPADRLQGFVRHHVTFFAQHMAEMKVLSHEAESLCGARGRAIVDLKRRYVDQLAELVAALGTEHDARIGAYALFGMLNWIYTWYDPDGAVTADALAEHFTRIALSGVTGQAPAVASSV